MQNKANINQSIDNKNIPPNLFVYLFKQSLNEGPIFVILFILILYSSRN